MKRREQRPPLGLQSFHEKPNYSLSYKCWYTNFSGRTMCTARGSVTPVTVNIFDVIGGLDIGGKLALRAETWLLCPDSPQNIKRRLIFPTSIKVLWKSEIAAPESDQQFELLIRRRIMLFMNSSRVVSALTKHG